jgi:hypothetical protein
VCAHARVRDGGEILFFFCHRHFILLPFSRSSFLFSQRQRREMLEIIMLKVLALSLVLVATMW